MFTLGVGMRGKGTLRTRDPQVRGLRFQKDNLEGEIKVLNSPLTYLTDCLRIGLGPLDIEHTQIHTPVCVISLWGGLHLHTHFSR